jgi:Right handed beta helix region
MLRTRTIALPLLLAVAAALATTQAQAAQRRFVSAAFGNDANTASGCVRIAPCRTFQAAMGVTEENEEMVVLDSGGYGPVTITKSVSLIAPTGVYAGISVRPNQDGVTIATPGVNVVLRGLSINGQGGKNGILMSGSSNSKLTVENCVISNLKDNGMYVAGSTVVRVSDTIIRDNGIHGIALLDGVSGTITRSVISGHVGGGAGSTTSAVVGKGTLPNTLTTVDVADSTLDGNDVGVFALSTDVASAVVKVSVRDSRVVQNKTVGLIALASSGASVTFSASNNIVSNNDGVGINSSSGARMWVSGNTVSDNGGIGLQNNDAIFESAGNNAVQNNLGGDVSGALTPIAKK